VHDLLHQRNQFDASLVAALEADRQVRVDVAQRVGAAFQFVVVVRDRRRAARGTSVRQARRRGVDGQLGKKSSSSISPSSPQSAIIFLTSPSMVVA
jgi:hypothetical protein